MRVRGHPPARVRIRAARGWTAVCLALLASWPLAMSVVVLASRNGTPPDGKTGPVMVLYTCVAILAGGRASRHPDLDLRTRRAWRLLVLALVLHLVDSALFAARTQIPAAAEVVRLCLVPLLFGGMLTFPVRKKAPGDALRLALDLGIVISGGFTLLWYFSLGPALVAQGRPGTFVGVAYPLADLALVVAASTALLRGAATQSRPLLLLAAAMSVWVVADVEHATLLLREGTFEVSGGEVEWACLISTFVLVALAAAEQCRVAGRHALAVDVDMDVRPASVLPYGAVVLAFCLLLVVAFRQGAYPWGGLVLCTMLMTAGVLGRQFLTLRENHELVISDQLTGLASRARLRSVLANALDAAGSSGQPAGALVIDLDGFKAVNDTLGHEVGDDLLVAFAGVLMTSVSRSDTVGRMGGDEFAVALPSVGSLTNAVAVVERILSRLETPVPVAGNEMRLRASIGVALSTPGLTVGQLLDHADKAMYRAKRNQTTGWAAYRHAVVPPQARAEAPALTPSLSPPPV